jgi:hypothetical protein
LANQITFITYAILGGAVTRDDIIRMAVQAGARPSLSPELWDFWNIRNTDLERFAALIAAHEREECAKVIENYCGAWDDQGYALAAAIRARETK